MASIRERGSTVAVLYRLDGKQTSQTFHDLAAAERFRDLIDLLGVQRAIAEIKAEQAHGFTVDQLAEAFFDWKRGDVEPRTLADYRRDYANWIQPFIGHRQAEAIDELDVQQLVDGWVRSGRLEPKSIADRHMILGGMYRYGSAKVRRLVTHNPCEETQLPVRKKKPPKGVTLSEWKALHAAAQRINPDAADLMLFIVLTGWRFSEATALLFRDVEEYDHDDRLIMFATMGAVFRRDADNRRIRAEGKAKSDAGLRRIKLTSRTAEMIRRRQVGCGPGDYVFTNAAGNPWRQNNFLYRTWPAILKASGIDRRPTPHWLRHTQVALLDRAGVSLAEMQRRIGHEDIKTTINTYGRMIDDISLDALDRLDALVDDSPGSQVVEGQVVPRELGGNARALPSPD